MAIPLGKLTIIIGAGLVGSVLSSEGRLWDVKDFVSGAFKIVTKNLHQEKDKSSSTGKPHSDSLLSQVNNLRQELQLLASTRSVTIVTGRSGSRTYSIAAIIVVGAVGYGYIWWKGWKLSDMMFVTRRGFSDACKSIGKDVDGLSSSIVTTKRHVGSRISQTENSIDEVTALNTCTKNEVSTLNGEMREIREKTDIVYGVVHTLQSRLVQIDSKQDVNNQGVVLLCDFVHQNVEQSKNAERIQAS
ncbi:uncharacterized protein M6B38_361470 [Iris pallida]|uniref:DUF1664 domain-containing protein n=1 Tax=Iris pallida TaxID=29817 RepID=A0AAX6GJV6_IRIPA|nr:uncharacterized protein M6B38_162495 [Iris pallida]KAJ6828833.1 uncharacterized protein M6B38_361470 [Iris pallida]